MKKERIYLVFTFLLLIPYLCSLGLIGIAYNALVRHAADWGRTIIGAVIGALIMFAIKATIQRPLDLLSDEVDEKLFKQFLRLFSIKRRKLLLISNLILDFFLCLLATIFIRLILPQSIIIGTSIGWVFLIMLISTCIGAYVEYDNLSIDPQQK
ncbi:hypothetical protein [Lactobacillus sp. PV034]|uniref:hypothetical protein n=1 Tax=Lactobacillus sp. PV034 TaxID=2594495 RepID=UPI002240401C|nr:hypothetical protein [Lactobacillus sp. PV034]QNQ80754.1 hypothetical protein FP432_03900 [Lactobacillus sp. PV034]